MTANQGEYGLLLSHADGVTTRYAYDAAGRLVKEGSKIYTYGYLDKVLSVTDGDTTRTFTYHADGQLASASCDGIGRAGAHPALSPLRGSLRSGDMRTPQTETFLWDGLALVKRGEASFINEPHIGGGNPVASSTGTSYFNDMLGTTVGTKSGKKYSAAALTAFGERLDNVDSTSPAIRSLGEGWFTGKPYVEGLGHTFLFRNYRASLAKWQTADPLGYPDGWNQLAYGVNSPISGVDLWGAGWSTDDFILYYYEFWKSRDIDTDDIGYTSEIWNVIATVVTPRIRSQITDMVLDCIAGAPIFSSDSNSFPYETDRSYSNFIQVHVVLAGGRVRTHSIVQYQWQDVERGGYIYRTYRINCDTFYYYSDSFSDPLAFRETVGFPVEVGIPYMYSHAWDKLYIWNGEYLLE